MKLRPDPGYIVKQCPRQMMYKIFVCHRYKQFFSFSVPLRIGSESDQSGGSMRTIALQSLVLSAAKEFKD